MIAPSSISRLRRTGWIRRTRSAPTPRSRTYSSRSSIDDVRWRGRLRRIAQPRKPRPAHVRVVDQQPVDPRAAGIGQAGRQGLERSRAGAYLRDQADPLQHGRGRNEHARRAQRFEHRAHDRLAAVRGPGRIGTEPDADAPIGKAEAAQAESGLQFRRMLAPGLVPRRIVSERRERHIDLARHERDHRLRRLLAGTETLAGVSQ